MTPKWSLSLILFSESSDDDEKEGEEEDRRALIGAYILFMSVQAFTSALIRLSRVLPNASISSFYVFKMQISKFRKKNFQFVNRLPYLPYVSQ